MPTGPLAREQGVTDQGPAVEIYLKDPEQVTAIGQQGPAQEVAIDPDDQGLETAIVLADRVSAMGTDPNDRALETAIDPDDQGLETAIVLADRVSAMGTVLAAPIVPELTIPTDPIVPASITRIGRAGSTVQTVRETDRFVPIGIAPTGGTIFRSATITT